MKLENFFKKLGPGLITGASDDDPSGILTYLQGGVMLGFGALWTVLATLPMMYAIQEMSGRIGLVTEKGLMRIIKEQYSGPVLFFIAAISALVITINIGADLLAMGTVAQGFVPLSNFFLLPAFTGVILFSIIFFSYRKFARVLKWLTLSLFFYVLTVLYLNIDWLSAIRETFIPNFSWSKNTILLLAAVFGTTISPYLFFWQANEEIEEEEEQSRKKSFRRIVVTKRVLKSLKEDTFAGMFISNAVAWFIIVGAAALAKSHGLGGIKNFEQASSVLQPLLGSFAYLAFSLGIIGTGLLAIPVLAGNIGYMFAEIFNWPEGMNKKFSEAKGFYCAISVATVVGMIINFFQIDPVTILIYTAVLYLLITPPIVYIILKIANNRHIMKSRTNSGTSNMLGGITFLVSLVLAAAYLISLL